MTQKTHQLIGITAASATYLFMTPNAPVTIPVIATVVFAASLGSLAPDIDQPTSSFWDHIPLGNFFGQITSRALGGHRNLSHSILGTGLFFVLIYWLCTLMPNTWPVNVILIQQCFLIGFIAHLAADSVTMRGIPLFWPLGNDMGFPPVPLDGIRIITGKWFENLVIFPVVMILFITLIALNLGRFTF